MTKDLDYSYTPATFASLFRTKSKISKTLIKMKKVFLTLAVIGTLTFAACGGGGESEATKEEPKTEETTEEPKTEEKTEEAPKEEPKADSTATKDEAKPVEEPKKEEPKK